MKTINGKFLLYAVKKRYIDLSFSGPKNVYELMTLFAKMYW